MTTIFAVAWWSDHPLVRACTGAAIIGLIGSAAYLTALLLGFLGDAALAQFRARFLVLRNGYPTLSALRVGAFVVFGAGVAVVFQLAQRDVFAPIQAFVLGATWPTVLSQVIAQSNDQPVTDLHAFIDKLAGKTTA